VVAEIEVAKADATFIASVAGVKNVIGAWIAVRKNPSRTRSEHERSGKLDSWPRRLAGENHASVRGVVCRLAKLCDGIARVTAVEAFRVSVLFHPQPTTVA